MGPMADTTRLRRESTCAMRRVGGLSQAIGLVVVLSMFAIGCARSSRDAGPSTTTATTAPLSPSEIHQPPQPATGPGGSDYAHGEWRESSGGEGAEAWYVFEPVEPQPASAPVAIVMHGYFEFAGYDQMYELIRHTVRAGTTVIYPRWQTDTAAPCPGPFDIEPCVVSATSAIRSALAYLESDPSSVRPDVDRTSYLGFSFGGILTVNLANRYADLGLPRPRAIFLDDPHDGGLAGFDEPALDDSLAGIPSDALLQCHVGAEGVIAGPDSADGSCNALWPLLGHIPARNKSLVMTVPDSHGEPALSSGHGVCAAPPGAADAYDWNFCWKTWDELRTAALDGTSGVLAMGDTPTLGDNGRWSDDTPVTSLVIRDVAPIHPADR